MKKIGLITATVAMLIIAAFSTQSITASSSSNKKFVKTSYKCQKSNCDCSGYWGYKHLNGTYEGNCSNSDGHGHTCGHGPEKHGLKKW